MRKSYKRLIFFYDYGMPDVGNVKALVGHSYAYRLRVGSYRVMFDWDDAIKVVSIQEVKKRDERTY
ncbi:type II toxin-antitoxin system RelE family toxin [Pseudomonas sp. LB3P14]